MMKSLFAGAAVLCLLAGPVAALAQAPTQYPLRPNALAIDTWGKAANAVAGAATLNKNSGVITTEALTTAAQGTYTLTLSDSSITATDLGFASVSFGTATTGLPQVSTVTTGPGTLTIVVQNDHPTAAFNGTLKVSFFALKY